jgi:NAD(P)-dependent dehydrogenase (short-subunit alcohol dehydrogenase family)
MGMLDGKVAIVTGAGNGVGRGEAVMLADHGAKVVVNDLGTSVTGDGADQKVADQVVEVIKSRGGEAIANGDSVSDFDGAKRMVEQAVDAFGGLDILVNNAGLYASLEMRPFDQIPLDEWRQVMDVNVASMFLTCRAAVPVMRERGGGRIVNISSGTPFRGVPFLLHYVTSKGAIVAFTRALAKELGKDKVLVNCVAPGFTMSAGVEAHPEVIEKLRDVSVAARTLQRDQVPEDVVGAVVYFCGPGSDFVTGQTIVIDGGQTFH